MTDQANPESTNTQDPHAWLEEVEGTAQLEWVQNLNNHASQKLETERFSQIKARILETLDDDRRIPAVTKHGGLLYNLWKDAQHPRGIWRRTTPESFATENPDWQILLDLDQLGKAEGVNWVWSEFDLLPDSYDRALIMLSRGGSDATVVREFDMNTLSFVQDGFYCPESKGWAGWADKSGNSVLVARDFGPDTMTSSGYPSTVRLWQRGTDVLQAQEVLRADPDDMGVWGHREFSEGYERTVLVNNHTFYSAMYYVTNNAGQLTQLDLPVSAEAYIHRQWLFVEPREPYVAGGTTYEAGSFIAINLQQFLSGSRSFHTLYTPGPTTSLVGKAFTPNHVVLNVLEHVNSRLQCHTFTDGSFTKSDLEVDIGAGNQPLNIEISAVDQSSEDAVWLTINGFLTPPTLALLSIQPTGAATTQVLKSMPALFDTSGVQVEQHFATSADGTRVPYFQISQRNTSGPTPTVLYGYGGFEVAEVPKYTAAIGRSWLEKGGTYVVANIRGGFEYGPLWHQSALKQDRHRAYQDFAAVAEDLVKRGVTTRQQLGVWGGSNGGLLIGNMLMTYGHLFGAAICRVPLLDMKRYSHLLAGASWMAEYGNPDIPQEWQFIQTFSPYHLHRSDAEYPPVLFTTSTRDDRVHPGHARKMAARMLEAGNDVTYFENTEGGHGGSATNEQTAYVQALIWEFLWQRLG